ncbi:MAG: hypothetical protein Q8N03_07855 [Ignavibacteria bacterium]|nr:hypothetical protein [Ignavibacteria bacterium]
MKIYTLFFLIILLLKSDHYGQTSEFETNAKNFEFNQMKLGLPLHSFLEKYPNAEKIKDEDDEIVEVESFKVENLPNAWGGIFRFLKKKLIVIAVLYSEEYLKSRGTVAAIAEKLIEKFGKGYSNEMVEDEKYFSISWDFKNVNRYVTFRIFDDGSGVLSIKDEEALREIRKEQAKKADFGF